MTKISMVSDFTVAHMGNTNWLWCFFIFANFQPAKKNIMFDRVQGPGANTKAIDVNGQGHFWDVLKAPLLVRALPWYPRVSTTIGHECGKPICEHNLCSHFSSSLDKILGNSIWTNNIYNKWVNRTSICSHLASSTVLCSEAQKPQGPADHRWLTQLGSFIHLEGRGQLHHSVVAASKVNIGYRQKKVWNGLNPIHSNFILVGNIDFVDLMEFYGILTLHPTSSHQHRKRESDLDGHHPLHPKWVGHRPVWQRIVDPSVGRSVSGPSKHVRTCHNYVSICVLYDWTFHNILYICIIFIPLNIYVYRISLFFSYVLYRFVNLMDHFSCPHLSPPKVPRSLWSSLRSGKRGTSATTPCHDGGIEQNPTKWTKMEEIGLFFNRFFFSDVKQEGTFRGTFCLSSFFVVLGLIYKTWGVLSTSWDDFRATVQTFSKLKRHNEWMHQNPSQTTMSQCVFVLIMGTPVHVVLLLSFWPISWSSLCLMQLGLKLQ